MLVAMTDQNERFVLQAAMSRNLLKQLRKERLFFCPQCKSNVQLKIGSIKIPHFAHLTKNDCETQFSEGETVTHLLGKHHLYQLFQQLGYDVELESYLPTLKQRPDLLVMMKNGKCIVIEFQCSTISKEYLLSRNKGYQSENIQPIWIPSTPPRKNLSTGMLKISLSEQLQQFVQTTQNQRYLLTYNPHQQQFIYFTNLLHIKDNLYLTKVQNLPLEKQLFPFYQPKNLKRNEFLHYYKTYLVSKENFLNYRLLISKKGINDLFLRSVYELRLSLSSLPPFLGLPLKGNESLKMFAVEWQTALFYFAHVNKLEIDLLDKRAIQYFLDWAKLSNTNESIALVLDYCKLLKQIEIQHVYSSMKPVNLIDLLYTQFLA